MKARGHLPEIETIEITHAKGQRCAALMLAGWIALLMSALVATGLRVAAVALDWRLPAWQAMRTLSNAVTA